MAELPRVEWTRREDLLALVAALGEGNARYVGGAVRDTLLGLEAHDIDIATPLEPQEVIARLDAAKIRSVPTGLKHGTITAIVGAGGFGRNVEITTLRKDVVTDGRHAEVAYTSDWQEDAARRDFTINALYADPATLAVSDFFGGLDDLAARRVRFIGEPAARIREDHLRILRYFRFQARFGAEPADDAAERACSDLSATLKGLSRERVGWELKNLLALADPVRTVVRMKDLGVLQQVLPEADPAALSALADQERQQSVEPDPIRRLAALLPPIPQVADQVAARLRLSIAEKKRLVSAAGRLDHPIDPRALAYCLGRQGAVDRLLLSGQSIAPLRDWEIPSFPLRGGKVVASGVKAGPEVARILHEIEDRWVSEAFPDETRVEQMLDEALKARA